MNLVHFYKSTSALLVKASTLLTSGRNVDDGGRFAQLRVSF